MENWKVLKDVVRSNISGDRQPGYTNVIRGNGYCNLKSSKDAYQAYRGLVDSDDFGQELLVHLYAIGHDSDSMLLECNCRDFYRLRKGEHHSEDKSRAQLSLAFGLNSWRTESSSSRPADVSSLVSRTARLALSESPSEYYNHGSMAVQPHYPNRYPSPPTDVEFQSPVDMAPPSPVCDNGQYHTNEDGTPINISHGVVRAAKRSVHIANIHKKTKKRDVAAFLKQLKIHNYEELDFHTDPSGKTARGTAIIHYRHTSDAHKAEEALKNRSLNNRLLRVKRAKESFPVDSPESSQPRVVNGSYGY